MSVSCECCVLPGRGLCNKLITHPEESYQLWCIIACNLETSRMRMPQPELGSSTTRKKKININTNIALMVNKCLYIDLFICLSACGLPTRLSQGHTRQNQSCIIFYLLMFTFYFLSAVSSLFDVF